MKKQDIIKILNQEFSEPESELAINERDKFVNKIADKIIDLQPTEREILKRSGYQTQGDFYLGVKWFKNFKR